ncbi:MAG TPA: hypothetical protein VM052_08125 [Candidatus Limnocylindrales bacterium]|nr:hypothetical protein [Candidatus Limnocylindrales bacterium]
MTWRYGVWSARHTLPLGVGKVAPLAAKVHAGDVIAVGTMYGQPVRVSVARRLGVGVAELEGILRVPLGGEVQRGALLARTGKRFARAVSAPIDGRVAHIRSNGDVEIAPIVGRWTVRSTLDGTVSASDDTTVTVDGAAWCLQGLAGYGADAIGELGLAVDGPSDELLPARVDVRQRERILFGGGRSSAEAIARAHACGVAGIVAGAVPAGGLRVVFGDGVGAHGLPARGDAPTVLCLLGFGHAPLPSQLFQPLAAFAGQRASIHTATARLFVFAPADFASATVAPRPASLALQNDWGGLRPVEGAASVTAETSFPSEVVGPAVVTDEGAVPAANVRAL